jgi:hypothetical protein
MAAGAPNPAETIRCAAPPSDPSERRAQQARREEGASYHGGGPGERSQVASVMLNKGWFEVGS